MGSRPRSLAPPARTEQLLDLLRRGRLLDDGQLRRLADAWNPDDPPALHLGELVHAGLLTSYQADQLVTGRLGRLRLGPYRLLDRLGSGGMGQVYKAEHLLLRRVVALKVLGRSRSSPRRPQPSGTDTPTGDRLPTPPQLRRMASLRREIEAAGRLSHPHLIAAHDACRIRGRLVLVLEYLEGIDLDRLVRENGPLAPSLAREVLRQSALALQYLHEHGLVHRDVKPANLLLTHTPAGEPHVKLLDLGLVCRAVEAGEELCGTPDYLAPERGLSATSTDIRSDLYSLGCTLYFLLAGRVPFPGGSWTGKLLRHQIEVPTPVADLRPDGPANLLGVLDRLMARDPAARIATPAQLVRELDACTSIPSIRPEPPAPRRWTSSLVGRLLLATVLVGGCAGALARLAWSLDRLGTKAASSGPVVPSPRMAVRDLAAALAEAKDGAVLELPDGRYVLPALALKGKAITLRAASGARPVLARAPGGSWDALLHSDRDLTLEGCELQGGSPDDPPAPIALVEQGKLVLRDCTVRQRARAPALALRRGSLLQLERCRVNAESQAIAVEAKGNVIVRESDLRVLDPGGTAVLLWASESARSAPLELTVASSTIQAGRVLALRAIAGPVVVNTANNRIAFQQGLVSLDGYRDPDDWKRVFRWRGQQDRYDATGPWLRLDGRPGSVWSEDAFVRSWDDRK